MRTIQRTLLLAVGWWLALSATGAAEETFVRISAPSPDHYFVTNQQRLVIGGESTSWQFASASVELALSGATQGIVGTALTPETGAWSTPVTLTLRPGPTTITATMRASKLFGGKTEKTDRLVLHYSAIRCRLWLEGESGGSAVYQYDDTMSVSLETSWASSEPLDVYLAILLPGGHDYHTLRPDYTWSLPNTPEPFAVNWIGADIPRRGVFLSPLDVIPEGEYLWICIFTRVNADLRDTVDWIAYADIPWRYSSARDPEDNPRSRSGRNTLPTIVPWNGE